MAIAGAEKAVFENRPVFEKRYFITDRVKRLKQAYLDAQPALCSDRVHLLTEYWKQSEGEQIDIRRAKAFKYILERMPIVIRDDELIVGSQTTEVRGCAPYPEHSVDWIINELDDFAKRDVQKLKLSKKDRDEIWEDCRYWDGKSVHDRTKVLAREEFGNRVDDAEEARVIFGAFSAPIVAGARCAADYAKVLNKGLNGIIEEAQAGIERLGVLKTAEDVRKRYFLQSVIIACEAVITLARRHAQLAREMARNEADPDRKRELETIAGNCEWVPANPPRTFREAVQSFWFTQLGLQLELTVNGISPGRFDQYMYPFYKKDMEEGRITSQEAGELLSCLWVKFTELMRLRHLTYTELVSQSMFQNLAIGGVDSEGKDATNELSYLILDVEEETKVTQPTISLRYHDGLPESFLIRAAEVVRCGMGKPAFFNDKTAITAILHHGLPLEDARNWAPVGCVEMSVPAVSAPKQTHGQICLAKCLELALNNGVDPLTGKQIGKKTGNPEGFKSFEELYEAFKTQLVDFWELCTYPFNIRYALHGDHVPLPFNAALISDCIERGAGIERGGLRYSQFLAMMPFGLVNTGNSLTAIKKLVFEDKEITMRELVDALAADFEGKEGIRKKLLEAPKYGNDDDYADEMVSKMFDLCTDLAPQYKNIFGVPLSSAYIGITSQYYHGKSLGASADGRKAYAPLADGSVSAFPGTDLNGPTAVVKSASKVDVARTTCTLLNLKFHPAALKSREGLKKFLALVKTYFDLGGYHVQFNVVSKETLLEAQAHPERYKDLIVRVAGFSVYWVDLAKSVQDEIIARTEHTL